MIISFEGMDGVGKSTISSLVSKTTGYKHETQKICTLAQIDDDNYRKFVKYIRNSSNTNLSLMFYVFRCMLDKENKEENLIVERSILSLYYFEQSRLCDENVETIINLDTIPDVIFLLYASIDERIKRIRGRNPLDEDLLNEESIFDGYEIMLNFAKKFNIPYVGINTEKYDINEIVNICSDIIMNAEKMNLDERIQYIKQMNDYYGFDDKYLSIERKLKI